MDHHEREALVAVDGSAIVAVGRYDRLPGSADAEVALVVRGHLSNGVKVATKCSTNTG